MPDPPDALLDARDSETGREVLRDWLEEHGWSSRLARRCRHAAADDADFRCNPSLTSQFRLIYWRRRSLLLLGACSTLHAEYRLLFCLMSVFLKSWPDGRLK
jgi:hypothetical protein